MLKACAAVMASFLQTCSLDSPLKGASHAGRRRLHRLATAWCAVTVADQRVLANRQVARPDRGTRRKREGLRAVFLRLAALSHSHGTRDTNSYRRRPEGWGFARDNHGVQNSSGIWPGEFACALVRAFGRLLWRITDSPRLAPGQPRHWLGSPPPHRQALRVVSREMRCRYNPARPAPTRPPRSAPLMAGRCRQSAHTR